MSKLQEIFESVKESLHWGPAVEPFHRAVIVAHEELQAAHTELRDEFEKLKAKFEDMFPVFSGERTYISPPVSIVMEGEVESPAYVPQAQMAAVLAISGSVPDDSASLVDTHDQPVAETVIETNAAAPEPASTSASPSAPDEPVAAAPNPAEPGITSDSLSLPTQPEPVSAGPDTTTDASTVTQGE